jgi:hypothetical protein
VTRPPARARERRPRVIGAKDRDEFLELLAAGWAVRHASRQSSHAFQRWYELKAADEEFAAAWAEAIEQGTQALEDEARRRAVDGVEEPVYQKGELVGSVRRYSDNLLMFLLRGRRPAVYRESATVELNAPVSVHIEPDPERTARVLAKLREVGLLTQVPETIDGTARELTEGDRE